VRRLGIAILVAGSARIALAGDATSLDALVAEALARNPELNVYSSEIAAAKVIITATRWAMGLCGRSE